MDRISARLEGGKIPLLSKGGKLTLIKATLATMPNYFLSLFTIPVAVANRIETFFRRFFWDNTDDHHRYHLVEWSICCRSLLNKGGLGIRCIRDHNRALLVKWLWRFGVEKENLWRKVVVARFVERSCWKAKAVRGRHGCGIWKSISAINEMFWKYIRFHLGSGVSIRLRISSPLKDNFLNIFRLALDLGTSVSNCFDVSRRVWDLGLRRNPNDWELGEFIRMLGLLGNFEPNHNRLDRWIWMLDREGKFNSKSFYEETSNVSTSVIPFKGI